MSPLSKDEIGRGSLFYLQDMYLLFHHTYYSNGLFSLTYDLVAVIHVCFFSLYPEYVPSISRQMIAISFLIRVAQFLGWFFPFFFSFSLPFILPLVCFFFCALLLPQG